MYVRPVEHFIGYDINNRSLLVRQGEILKVVGATPDKTLILRTAYGINITLSKRAEFEMVSWFHWIMEVIEWSKPDWMRGD